MKYIQKANTLEELQSLLVDYEKELEYLGTLYRTVKDENQNKIVRRDLEKVLTSVNGLKMVIENTSTLSK